MKHALTLTRSFTAKTGIMRITRYKISKRARKMCTSGIPSGCRHRPSEVSSKFSSILLFILYILLFLLLLSSIPHISDRLFTFKINLHILISLSNAFRILSYCVPPHTSCFLRESRRKSGQRLNVTQGLLRASQMAFQCSYDDR